MSESTADEGADRNLVLGEQDLGHVRELLAVLAKVTTTPVAAALG